MVLETDLSKGRVDCLTMAMMVSVPILVEAMLSRKRFCFFQVIIPLTDGVPKDLIGNLGCYGIKYAFMERDVVFIVDQDNSG